MRQIEVDGIVAQGAGHAHLGGGLGDGGVLVEQPQIGVGIIGRAGEDEEAEVIEVDLVLNSVVAPLLGMSGVVGARGRMAAAHRHGRRHLKRQAERRRIRSGIIGAWTLRLSHRRAACEGDCQGHGSQPCGDDAGPIVFH